jgi:thiol-disulfide isomerase/thioredoxin
MNTAWRMLAAAVLVGLAPLAWAQNGPKPDQPKAAEQPTDQKPAEQPKPSDKKPAVTVPRQPQELNLQAGGAAPEVKVYKWVKGDPVTRFEKGRTYVVEFWATWCQPCRENIPHLTGLQQKYKKVKFIGVSVWENSPPHHIKDLDRDLTPEQVNEAYFGRVKRFVDETGEAMGYTVAFDGVEGAMAQTWMNAAGQGSIPAAFIVNGDGKVAWIGHPGEIEEPLSQILAGTYDIKSAAEKSGRALAIEKKQRALYARLAEAMQTKNREETLKVLEECVELDPVKNEPMLVRKFKMLQEEDEKGAYAFLKRVAEGPGKDKPQTLNAMAWMILDDQEVVHRDLDAAMTLAKQADEAAKHESAPITDTLARAYFEKGDSAKAVELEIKAISQLKEEEEAMRGQMEAALRQYKAGKK